MKMKFVYFRELLKKSSSFQKKKFPSFQKLDAEMEFFTKRIQEELSVPRVFRVRNALHMVSGNQPEHLG
jgi:hypothetical protein